MIVVLDKMLWLLQFAIGACVFSFLNVVIYRLPRKENMFRGRSHCRSCGRTLTAGELIPIVSYLKQKKRCRGCGGRIPGRYCKMEFMGGLAFVCCGAAFGRGAWGLISLRGLVAFTYLGILAVVAFIDWDIRMIYDRFHICIMLLGAAAVLLFPEHPVADRVLGMAVVAFPMFLLALGVEGSFGGGDIKLMAASGFLLGWQSIVFAMLLGLAAGSVYSIGMMAAGKLTRKNHIALGPFLAIGLAAALFFGDDAVAWYLSLL